MVYPQIQAWAKEEKAEIHWGDETGIQNDAYNTKGFAPKGKTPVVRINATKSRVNMISSITNQGKVRFMLYKENMTSQVLIKFMSRLVKGSERKVYLILDNLRVHHSKLVKAWLEDHKEEIEVFYLPSYSPELNPDEYLNGDLKHYIRSGLPARTVKALTKKTRSFMRKLQNRPKHVRNYNTILRICIWCQAPEIIQKEDVRMALLPSTSSDKDDILSRSLGNGFNIYELQDFLTLNYTPRALDESRGNKSKSAALLELNNYQTLTNWIKKYDIKT